MPFTPKDWRDKPDFTTPITAAALEDLETRLSAYSDTQPGVPGATGPSGATGPPGATGPTGVGANWRGVWSGATTYALGDGAYRNGLPYVSNVGSNLNHDPATDSGTNWGYLNFLPFTSVDALSAGPRSVTDWGPTINAALAAGVRHFEFGPYTYPFSTTISFRGYDNIRFHGAGGWNWPDSRSVNPTRLLWKGGAGSGPAIRIGENVGPDPIGTGGVISDMQVMYDHTSGFDGTLIQGPIPSDVTDNQTNGWHFVENIFGTDDGGATQTAHCLIDMSLVMGWKVIRNGFVGAHFAIHGCTTNTQNQFCDDADIRENEFHACDYYICNPGHNWTIESNTFSFGSVAVGRTYGAIVEDHTISLGFGPPQQFIRLIGNRFWDFTTRDTLVAQLPVQQGPYSLWDLVAEDNWFFNAGMAFQFQGGGDIRVLNTHFGNATANGTMPRIDLGNATGSLTPPWALLKGAVTTSGGTFAANTYYWKVTATNASGQTTASWEVSQAVATNGTVELLWDPVPYATGYKVYRSTSSGGEGSTPALVASPSIAYYKDTGTAVSAGAVPGSNTATTTFSGAKRLVVVQGHDWGRDDLAGGPFGRPVVNLGGHESLHLEGNLNSTDGAISTIERERVHYNAAYGSLSANGLPTPTPTIHAGATNVLQIVIWGTDAGHYVLVTTTGSPQAAGTIVDIAFAHAYASDPQSIATRQTNVVGGFLNVSPFAGVSLTPMELTGQVTAGASQAAGAYIVETAGSNGYSIAVANSVPANTIVGFFCRPLWL